MLLALCVMPTSLYCFSSEANRATLSHEGRTLEVLVSPQFTQAAQQNTLAWVDFLSQSLLQVYGRWPRKHWKISVTPASAAAGDPIPWAQVHRATVDHVEFFVSPAATSEDLKAAWTGYHELAHLLIPYRGWGNTWFSEGLASYYQNILQARAGILSEQEMWQNLHDAFQRGVVDNAFDGQRLQSVSANLRKDGGFMRVYWSGASYFLAADVRLRRQSAGKLSLDLALERLNQCCADEKLSARQIADKLDELNEVLFFGNLYQKLNDSTETPAFQPIFASLGIDIVGGIAQLQSEGPGARLRLQIAQPIPAISR